MSKPNVIPDYLVTPHGIQPSFHCRTGKPPQAEVPKIANEYGFPVPGIQSPTAVSVMAKDYFVTNDTWNNILDHGEFDYIVIGSGFTALAFITEALRLDHTRKILCIERGDFWLPSHFQNLPLPFKMVLGGPSETFPWTLTRKTYEEPSLKFCHGSCPFFGGRSTFWSAWCPQPPENLMRDFPESLLAPAREKEFWDKAIDLLNVKSASDINDTIFAELQAKIDERLKWPLPPGAIPTADGSEPARLAVGSKSRSTTLKFNKFSTPGPMLDLFEQQRRAAKAEDGKIGSPLQLMVNCTVASFNWDDTDGVVRAIATSQGVLSWRNDKTKIILCAGAFPNATMILNSFPRTPNVGKRVTGHFLTHIAARVPIEYFGEWKNRNRLEIGAHYLSGVHPVTGRQYHVQITAIHSQHPDDEAEDAARECPDYAAAATYEQLLGSENYVVFICATLGEFTDGNPQSYLKKNKGQDPTTNVTLQYTLDDRDKALWDCMDEATYQTIETMAGENGACSVQYWNENVKKWEDSRPPQETIRIPGVVHECSTAYVGPRDQGGSLDEYYRPHGVKNVFVTGGAIFPTAGSWNPTLTMCGYAQDLARKLEAFKDKLPEPSQDMDPEKE